MPARNQLALFRQAFRQSGEAIVITDAHGRIVAANPAFTVMTGLAEEGVIGRDAWKLAAGQNTAEDLAAIGEALIAEGTWNGQLQYCRPDGIVMPLEAAITAVRDGRQRIGHFVGTFSEPARRGAGTDRIIHLAHHDALTGLLNRHALQEELQRLLAAARRENSHVALLLLDLDRFKDINDTLGHPVGDKLLIEMARRLTGSVRTSDVVARLGGDEFLIALPKVEHPMAVARLAGKLRLALSDIYRIDEHSLYATPSIGITLFPADGDDAETLIRNADTAMYHAKAAGRDNFKFFTPAMNAAATERLKLETALRQALETGTLAGAQFRLEFQPQRHLSDGRIIGLEALARWRHPELGEISPARFIPVAEETGLIQPLGDWVFWEACRQMRLFKDAGVRGIRMAVNLSAQQLREEELPAVVRGALACYDMAPEELELEITETTAMASPEITIAILQQLADIGIALAVDDFGTGYSSLSYLKQLPIHRIKLDRSLVKDISADSRSAAICAATIVLGHNLGLELVAEGVETAEQEDHLRQLGCDAMQGFLFSRPLPAERAMALLLDRQAP